MGSHAFWWLLWLSTCARASTAAHTVTFRSFHFVAICFRLRFVWRFFQIFFPENRFWMHSKMFTENYTGNWGDCANDLFSDFPNCISFVSGARRKFTHRKGSKAAAGIRICNCWVQLGGFPFWPWSSVIWENDRGPLLMAHRASESLVVTLKRPFLAVSLVETVSTVG